MRLLQGLILFFLIANSCTEGNKGKMAEEKNKFETNRLSKELLKVLTEYQKVYPFPKEGGNSLNVYEVAFYKSNNDTLVEIRRSSAGVEASFGQTLTGVYTDVNLLPVIVKDSAELYSKNFVLKPLRDTSALNRFRPLPAKTYPESYPPIYQYRIHGRSLFLQKIDTIWQTWRF